MRTILLLLFIFLVTISAMGQKSIAPDPGKQPYVLVDTFHVELKHLVLSPEKIESIQVYKDSNALAAYGDKARYGAVIVHTKPEAKMMRLADLLDQYKISSGDRTLRVMINREVVNNPELILIEKSEVLGVEVASAGSLNNPPGVGTDERVILIKTASANTTIL